MTRTSDDRGSVALTAIVALPLVVVVSAAVLELGALRLETTRAREAADLAVIVGVNDQDEAELARSGHLRLAGDAVDVTRTYFATNLEHLGAALAEDPQTVAASADIAAFAAGSIDGRDGTIYDRPTVRLFASVPIRTPLLGALLGPTVTRVDVRTSASAR